jgi:hypothetical protein
MGPRPTLVHALAELRQLFALLQLPPARVRVSGLAEMGTLAFGASSKNSA